MHSIGVTLEKIIGAAIFVGVGEDFRDIARMYEAGVARTAGKRLHQILAERAGHLPGRDQFFKVAWLQERLVGEGHAEIFQAGCQRLHSLTEREMHGGGLLDFLCRKAGRRIFAAHKDPLVKGRGAEGIHAGCKYCMPGKGQGELIAAHARGAAGGEQDAGVF